MKGQGWGEVREITGPSLLATWSRDPSYTVKSHNGEGHKGYFMP